jgi:hypothetical protein
MPASAAQLTGLKENSMHKRPLPYPYIIGVPILIALLLAGCTPGRVETALPSTPTSPPLAEPTAAPTDTPAPTQTPEPALIANPEPLPTLETVSLEGLLYYDDFTDPNSGWGRISFDNSYIGYHEPGYYHVEVHAPNDDQLVPVPDQSFSDFSLQVEVFADADLSAPEGDYFYGLVLRRSGNLFYAITISPSTKNWKVSKHSLSGVEILQEGNADAIQGVGTANMLQVDARGESFNFQINGETVARLTDADYAEGEIGFYVQTLDNSKAHIHFESITVREIELVQEGLLYYDDFTDPSSGWGRLSFDNSYIGYHEPRFYHVEVHAPNDDQLVPVPDQTFNDFTAEVEAFLEADLSIIEGDSSYGLVFRRSGNLFYAFTISPFTKDWRVTKHSLSGREILQEGNSDLIQGAGVANILRVDARGEAFIFHINAETVARLRDAEYTGGEIGFFVQTLDNPKTHIHFDTLTIREVELPQQACNLVAQSVNLRSGPGRDFRRLATLLRGDQFEPLERTQNGLWIRVRLEGSDQEGWVANDRAYAQCTLPTDELPVVEP